MAQVIWSEPALRELDAIADFIALDKPKAARSFVKKVFEKVKLLKRFSSAGTGVPEVKDLPYRQLVISPCRVLYREDKAKIIIVSVIRNERKR